MCFNGKCLTVRCSNGLTVLVDIIDKLCRPARTFDVQQTWARWLAVVNNRSNVRLLLPRNSELIGDVTGNALATAAVSTGFRSASAGTRAWKTRLLFFSASWSAPMIIFWCAWKTNVDPPVLCALAMWSRASWTEGISSQYITIHYIAFCLRCTTVHYIILQCITLNSICCSICLKQFTR